jgi:hypothetical protein
VLALPCVTPEVKEEDGGLYQVPPENFIGTKVDEDHVWNDVKEGKVRGYSIEGFFNEVGVAMSGVKNYEAELVLELENIISGLVK